jgi:hypothetical protein
LFFIWPNDAVDLFNPLGHIFADVTDKIKLGVFIFCEVSLGTTEMHPECNFLFKMLSYSLFNIAQAVS